MTKWGEINMINREEYQRVCDENLRLRNLIKAKSPLALKRLLENYLGELRDTTRTNESNSKN